MEDGVNGIVAASDEPGALADAIAAVHAAGPQMRESTAAWFATHAERLSVDASIHQVMTRYAGLAASSR